MSTASPGLRVLIVDDERPARQKVRRFLATDPDIGSVFEAGDGVRAVEIIRAESPDVAFLDVQMPGLDGFGVVEALAREVLPRVVFVTAFDHYAVRAFDAHAVDYLLKPFDGERFGRALARAKEAVAQRHVGEDRDRVRGLLAEVQRQRPERPDRILVEQGERVVLLKLAQVERMESARNYVAVHAGGERYRVRATLNNVEARLDPARFVRVSRSEIVNVDYVTELVPWGHGDYVVVLRGGTRTRLSRRYRDRLERFAVGQQTTRG
jgi:two-component system, LytTR family, response regulator